MDKLNPHVSFEFQVEKIIGVSIDGAYQVQWSPAWVSKFHLVGCEHLIEEFLQKQSECVKTRPESPLELELTDDSNQVSDTQYATQLDAVQPESNVQTAKQTIFCKVEVAEVTATNVEESLTYSTIEASRNGLDPSIGVDEEGGLMTSRGQPLEDHNQLPSEIVHAHNELLFQNDNAWVNCVKSKDETHFPSVKVVLEPLTTGSTKARDMCKRSTQSSCENSLTLGNGDAGDPYLSENETGCFLPSGMDCIEPCNQLEYSVIQKDGRDQADGGSEEAFEEGPPIYPKFECTYCSKKFLENGGLNRHIRTHTGERPLSCNLCEYSCKQKVSLTAHMCTHTGVKPFSCSFCGKSFVQKNNLLRHQRSHTGDRPYACSYCSSSFSHSSTLKQHLRIHTGERPYICSVCGKGFTSWNGLKYHSERCVCIEPLPKT